MKKRLVASVLLVVMLVSLLAACGEKTPADTTGTPNNGEQQVSTNFTVPEGGYDGSAVTITFYNTMGTNLAPVLADYIEVFNEKYPNITGVFLDDVTSAFHKVPDQAERHRLRVEMLKTVKENLKKAPRPLDTYITWYWHQDPYPGMMDYVDGISFWTWNSEELPLLKERFEAIEEKYKDKKILLGIYLYDFYNRRPVSVEMMELQCNYALELLKEGRIDGMIFEANSTMGVRLPSELWLRDWIKQVKYTEVPD